MPWIFAISVLLLGYVYAGYPALIWLLARTRGRPVRRGPFGGGTSVLIAAHDEADVLPRKLENLLELAATEPVREILVGLDGCTDGTADRVRAALAARENRGLVRTFEFDRPRGKAATLNDLMAKATQPILVMMDARQRVEAGAIPRLLENFADPQVGVASGALAYESADGAAQRGAESYWGYETFIRRCESRFWAVPGATGALYAVRRELCAPIPENTLVDDVLIPMRAVLKGFRCLFEPAARVFDLPTARFGQERIRKRRTLAGIWQIGRLEPRLYSFRSNPIAFQWISHKFLRLLTPFLVLAVLVAAGEQAHRCAGVEAGCGWAIAFWGMAVAVAVSGIAYGAARWSRSRLLGLLGAFWGVNWALVQAARDAATGRFEARWKMTGRG